MRCEGNRRIPSRHSPNDGSYHTLATQSVGPVHRMYSLEEYTHISEYAKNRHHLVHVAATSLPPCTSPFPPLAPFEVRRHLFTELLIHGIEQRTIGPVVRWCAAENLSILDIVGGPCFQDTSHFWCLLYEELSHNAERLFGVDSVGWSRAIERFHFVPIGVPATAKREAPC